MPEALEDDLFKFRPPYLFNVEINLNWGFTKKLYLCKGVFNITEHGRYFKVDYKKVPEYYKMSCQFTSLLPDMQNLLDSKFNWNGNSNGGDDMKVPEIPKKESTPSSGSSHPIQSPGDGVTRTGGRGAV